MTEANEGALDGLDRTEIGGEVDADLPELVDRFGLVERGCDTRCSSGDPFRGRWRGVPLSDVLVDVDPTATHLLVEAEDGFRVCVDVGDAIDGILAVQRLDGDASNGLPRFVVPGLEGTRMVKNVARIESTHLEGTDDPHDLEALNLDEKN